MSPHARHRELHAGDLIGKVARKAINDSEGPSEAVWGRVNASNRLPFLYPALPPQPVLHAAQGCIQSIGPLLEHLGVRSRLAKMSTYIPPSRLQRALATALSEVHSIQAILAKVRGHGRAAEQRR